MFLTCKLFHLFTSKQVNRNCKNSKAIQFIGRTICEFGCYVYLAVSLWDDIIMHIVLVSPLLIVESSLLSNSCHLPLHIELDFLLNLKKNKPKPQTNQNPKQTKTQNKNLLRTRFEKSFQCSPILFHPAFASDSPP